MLISTVVLQVQPKLESVVDKQEEFDVPVTHEQLFIQRRPIAGTVTAAGIVEGETEVVRIPLSEEGLRVEKDTVATEGVIISKRSVTEMQHVSETTRKKVLDVGNTDNEIRVTASL